MVYINSKTPFGVDDWNEAAHQLRYIIVYIHTYIYTFEIHALNQ